MFTEPATSALLAFGLPGGSEWIILLVLGLIIFGRRLPEVGRSLGKSIVEFKRGIKGIEDEIETESSAPKSSPRQIAADNRAPMSSTNKVDQASEASQL